MSDNVKIDIHSDGSQPEQIIKRLQQEMGRMAADMRRMAEQQKKYSAEEKKAAEENKRKAEEAKRAKQEQIELEKKGGEAAKQAQKEAAEGAHFAESALGSMVGRLGSLIAGYNLLQGSINLATAAIEHQQQMQRKAADAHLDAASVREQLMLNVDSAEWPIVQRKMMAISAARGIDLPDVERAASEAFAARAGLPMEQTLPAIDMALQFTKNTPANQTTVASGLMDLQGLTRFKDDAIGTAAEKNMGIALAAQEFGRATQLPAIMEYQVPAAKSLKSFGDDTNDALALVAALGNAMNDPDAMKSSTAATNFGKDLEKFLPEKDRAVYDDRGRKVRTIKGTGLKSTDERIEFLQRDENQKLVDMFMSTNTFEAKAEAHIKMLLDDRESDVAKNYRFIKERMPDESESVERTRGKLKQVLDDDTLQIAAEAKRDKASTNQMLRDNLPAAQTAVGSQTLTDVRDTMDWGEYLLDSSKFDYWWHTFVGGKDPQQAKVNELNKIVYRNDWRGTPKGQHVEEMIDAMPVLPGFIPDYDLARNLPSMTPLEQATTRFREGVQPATGDLELLRPILPDEAEAAYERREKGDIRPEDNRQLREVLNQLLEEQRRGNRTLETLEKKVSTDDGIRRAVGATAGRDLDTHVRD